MTSCDFDRDLASIERHLASLSASLHAQHAQELVEAATRLQEESIALLRRAQSGQYMAGAVTVLAKQRLQSIGRGLSLVRGHLLRNAAHVDLSLAQVLPCEKPVRYAGKSSPYGSVPRSSGEFRVALA